MKTQSQRVLEAFLSAPNKLLTTVQLHNLPYITNVRARISNLREDGHLIECHRIKGTKQSIFSYCGHYVISPEEIWRTLPNGFQLLEA